MLRLKDAGMRIMLQMEEEDRETKGRDDAVQQRSDDAPTPDPTPTPLRFFLNTFSGLVVLVPSFLHIGSCRFSVRS